MNLPETAYKLAKSYMWKCPKLRGDLSNLLFGTFSEDLCGFL